MQIKPLLTVARISNLPTVWTNILAAAVLAHESGQMPASIATPNQASVISMLSQYPLLIWFGTLFALSLMYLGGMFLNDAFDAEWDKANNNLRPIVTGAISDKMAWMIGSIFLVVAVLAIAILYKQTILDNSIILWYQNFYGLFAGLLLASTIIVYNAYHKDFTHSAIVMGACRFGVYMISALLLAQITPEVTLAALSLLLYIAGLTYLARHEYMNQLQHLWPALLLLTPIIVATSFGYDSLYFWLFLLVSVTWIGSRLWIVVGTNKPNVRACIGGLLAAIPLLDGLILASVNAIIPSLICLLVFLTIPQLHRWISGT